MLDYRKVHLTYQYKMSIYLVICSTNHNGEKLNYTLYYKDLTSPAVFI